MLCTVQVTSAGLKSAGKTEARTSSAAAGCSRRTNCARKAVRCSEVGLNRKRMVQGLAVSPPTKPARQIGRQPANPVEGRDGLAHEARVGPPITAERPLQGVSQTFP